MKLDNVKVYHVSPIKSWKHKAGIAVFVFFSVLPSFIYIGIGSTLNGLWQVIMYCIAGAHTIPALRALWSRPVRFEVDESCVAVIRSFPLSPIIIPLDTIHRIARLHPKIDHTLQESMKKIKWACSRSSGPQTYFYIHRDTWLDPSNKPEYLIWGGGIFNVYGLRPPHPFRISLISYVTNSSQVVFIAGNRNYAFSLEHPDDFIADICRVSNHKLE